jgi:ubiquinone/menaquinone biosynthesis C-methylase UbiE
LGVQLLLGVFFVGNTDLIQLLPIPDTLPTIKREISFMKEPQKGSAEQSWRHNKKQYDLYAKEYDEKRHKPEWAFWNNYLDTPAVAKLLGKNLRGRQVLDLACGTGIFSRKMTALGAKIIGLDTSQSMIKIASARAAKTRFIVGDARRLPFETGSFDIVVSNLLIHYLKDLKPLFAEIDRVLVADGEFVFSFHHPIAEVANYRIVRGKATAELHPYYHNDSYRWGMAKKMVLISYHHTFTDIFSALKKSGFVVADLCEPRPRKGSKSINPRAYEVTSQFPNFCAIRAVKKD